MTKIIFFLGQECNHCHVMFPLVDRLEKEHQDMEIQRLEVWHHPENVETMKQYREAIKKEYGEEGLPTPTFINLDTGKALVGETSYEDLEAWAMGK
ncbi:MAG: thioredoxin family protein [DPANN group archaeon]|nr:thioredoxin family protein [DPANN group archaeon]